MKGLLFSCDAAWYCQRTPPRCPIIQVVQGQRRLTLGDEAIAAGEGRWVYLPVGPRHTVAARTSLVMLLQLKRRPEMDDGGLAASGR